MTFSLRKKKKIVCVKVRKSLRKALRVNCIIWESKESVILKNTKIFNAALFEKEKDCTFCVGIFIESYIKPKNFSNISISSQTLQLGFKNQRERLFFFIKYKVGLKLPA